MWRVVGWWLTVMGCAGLIGCGGDAQMELAAADALTALAVQMEAAANEYHDEIDRGDQARQDAVIDAFVSRVQSSQGDAGAVDGHVAAFRAAMERLWSDRQTEFSRRATVGENVEAIREVAGGLRRLAIDSLTLNDEMRRYLESWMEIRRGVNAKGTQSGTGTTEGGRNVNQ